MSVDEHDAHAGGPGAVAAEVQARGITEVIHFTTSRGLIGILAQRLLQARSHLSEDKYLEHIYVPNTAIRREDPKYWRYVNMSVSRPNTRLFEYSKGWRKSDPTIHWVILSFVPRIISQPGVLFSTSNMMYDGVEPLEGHRGFQAMFADPSHDGYGRMRRRAPGTPPQNATNMQAELLYPDRVSTEYLQRIYAANDEDAAHVEGIVGTLDHDDVPVEINRSMFGS